MKWDVNPDTLLSSIVGEAALRVNSRHHQGIRRLGKGLMVNAIAPDGLIEGVELPDHPFVLGCSGTRNPSAAGSRQQALFSAFEKACAARHESHGGQAG